MLSLSPRLLSVVNKSYKALGKGRFRKNEAAVASQHWKKAVPPGSFLLLLPAVIKQNKPNALSSPLLSTSKKFNVCASHFHPTLHVHLEGKC